MACLHTLIEDVAYQVPEAEAIDSWDGSLTYGQMIELAKDVTRILRNHGVRPGLYVPFAYEKSLWTVVVCLGIMMAGGAFCPLNVNEPETRLRSIFEDLKTQILVTSSKLAAKFRHLMPDVVVIDSSTVAHDGSAKVSCNNSAMENSANEHEAVANVKPTDPVFVLFTSGSTGQPKGMIHTHESICTQWLEQGQRLGYYGARVLQFAAVVFDVFIIETFTALIYRGCVCIPSEADRQSNIVEFINTYQVDHAFFTPSFLGLIQPSDVPSLKVLLTGGEALPQDRIRDWAGKVRFIQIYGPAEVGICATMEMEVVTRPETVGYPLSNQNCWLVDPDDHDQLVPVGAVGEMVVAGSLAIGYLNNPAKTQSSFIGPPVWARYMALSSTRFFKTGDLLRLNVDRFDGAYDFVGRKDAQIKLRGQRIEPGEVEYYLGQLPGVGNVMVAKPQSGLYAAELVAIVEMRVKHYENARLSVAPIFKLSLSTVQSYLLKHVPGFMIPTAYIEVEKLPCVPSMKIDRRQVLSWLDELEQPSLPLKNGYKDHGALEEHEVTAHCVSSAVSDILGRKNDYSQSHVCHGRDLVLQQAGFDSIQVMSLAMFIRKTFNITLSAATLLDPEITVRNLAKAIDDATSPLPNGDTVRDHKSLKSIDVVHELEALIIKLQESMTCISANAKDEDGACQISDVILTGATGYLGSAILNDLLERDPPMNIHVLLRCSSQDIGLQHIINKAIEQGWWDQKYLSRLHILLGDLSQPRLGLSPEAWQMLQDPDDNTTIPLSPASVTESHASVRAIIHAGAVVHYGRSYSALKPVNVNSTLSLLSAFAGNPKMTRLIYVSGGVYPDNTDTIMSSPTYANHLNDSANGYTQSKTLAEHVVRRAATDPRLRGQEKAVKVVKPGYIIGSPERGIANRTDYLWRLIAGCIEIAGFCESEVGKWIFLADVNAVASRTVGALFEEHQDRIESETEVERLLQGIQFEAIWSMLKEDFGYGIESMQEDLWKERLVQHVTEAGEKHMLWPLMDTFEKESGRISVEWQPDDSQGEENARAKAAVRRNVEYLIDVGFLPTPPASGADPHQS